MLRILITLITVLVVNGEAVSKPVSLPRQHVVEITAFSFQPQRTVVSPGDTIVWINRDIVPHSVTANGGTWESQILEEGQSVKIVVEDTGVYSYFCKFHPHMTGELATQ